MPKRITITYTCDHAGERIPDVVEKSWDSAPQVDRACYCLRDNEKGCQKPTKMKILSVEVIDSKPE